jgi:hypothetical protein
MCPVKKIVTFCSWATAKNEVKIITAEKITALKNAFIWFIVTNP